MSTSKIKTIQIDLDEDGYVTEFSYSFYDTKNKDEQFSLREFLPEVKEKYYNFENNLVKKIQKFTKKIKKEQMSIWAINESWEVLKEFESFEDASKWAKENEFFQILYQEYNKPVHVFISNKNQKEQVK